MKVCSPHPSQLLLLGAALSVAACRGPRASTEEEPLAQGCEASPAQHRVSAAQEGRVTFTWHRLLAAVPQPVSRAEDCHTPLVPVRCHCAAGEDLLGLELPKQVAEQDPEAPGWRVGSTLLSPAGMGARIQAVQANSSDQSRQCWVPSRHSLLGMQEQNWKCAGLQLHHSCPHGGQAAAGKDRKEGTEMLLLQ